MHRECDLLHLHSNCSLFFFFVNTRIVTYEGGAESSLAACDEKFMTFVLNHVFIGGILHQVVAYINVIIA